jgi:nucleoside transporter
MNGVIGRLSVMMFLQFFVWGAWYTTIAVYMTNQGMGTLTHWPYTVNPIAAIAAPFFVGLVADRFFATERVFAILHLLGGVLLLAAPQTAGNPGLFIVMLLLYNLCYMPTIALSNSLAFHNISDQEKQFPRIRVWGTIGWIVAGLFISFGLGALVSGIRPEQTALPLYTAGVASLVLAGFSFALPHTPPPARGQVVSARSVIGLDAFQQLGSRPFYVFIVAALLLCIPLAAYYNFTQLYLETAGVRNIAATQTLGQMSETVFMFAMPFIFARWGVKRMLLAGMAAWVLRYVLFALGAPDAVYWMIVLGILLHGICYDFFFVTGMIYVDKKSTAAIRGQAQGFLVLMTQGIGLFVGAQLTAALASRYTTAEGLDWKSFWFYPAVAAAVVLVAFLAVFRDRVRSDVTEGEVATAAEREDLV